MKTKIAFSLVLVLLILVSCIMPAFYYEDYDGAILTVDGLTCYLATPISLLAYPFSWPNVLVPAAYLLSYFVFKSLFLKALSVAVIFLSMGLSCTFLLYEYMPMDARSFSNEVTSIGSGYGLWLAIQLYTFIVLFVDAVHLHRKASTVVPE